MAAPSPDDLIDRVDNEDHVVGTVPRRLVFEEQAGFRTVHVLVFNRIGELLLQQVAHLRFGRVTTLIRAVLVLVALCDVIGGVYAAV